MNARERQKVEKLTAHARAAFDNETAEVVFSDVQGILYLRVRPIGLPHSRSLGSIGTPAMPISYLRMRIDALVNACE